MSLPVKKFASLFLAMAFVAFLLCCSSAPSSFPELFSVQAEALHIDTFEYIIENNEVTITACDKTTSGVLTIPDKIDGYPVTAINDSAFIDCTELTSVVIPDSVKKIGTFAFQNCKNMTAVTLPSGLSEISAHLFSGCPALTQLTIPNGVKKIGCFSLSSTSISKLTLPASVEAVELCGFPSTLEEITVINAGCYFEEFALYGIKKITGYENSTAQKEALLYNAEFVSLGNQDIARISMQHLPEIADYLVGSKTLDWHGIVFTVEYENGSTVTKTDGYELSGFDASKPGTCRVTLSYQGFETAFDIQIIDTTEKPVITLGKKIGFQAIYGEPIYVSFVPPATETYSFVVRSSADIDAVLYDAAMQEIAKPGGLQGDGSSGDSLYHDSARLEYELEEGKSYYYSVFSKNKDGVSVMSISLSEHSHQFINFRCATCGSLAEGVILGDIDNDNTITAADARLALRCSVSLENYANDSREWFCCDVDNDASVTAGDARFILRAAVGLEDSTLWK